MKKLLLTLSITLAGLLSNAQTDFRSAVLKGKQMLDSASGYETAMAASNYFERLAVVNANEWLAPYYAALSSLSAGIMSQEDNKKDECYERGLDFVEKAKTLKHDKSELLALEGYLKLMYIANSPMKRAPTQTGAAFDLLEEAKKLNPSNPRPYYVHGQHLLYTPKFFGGGAKSAIPLLSKASEQFKVFVPANDMMPQWGSKRCEKLLNDCRAQLAEK